MTSQQISTDCTHLAVAAGLKTKKYLNSTFLDHLKDAEKSVTKATDEVCRVIKLKVSEDNETCVSSVQIDSTNYSYNSWKDNLDRRHKILHLQNDIQEKTKLLEELQCNKEV